MTTNPNDTTPEEEADELEPLDDDERTVQRLLQGAQNPPGDIERGAAGLPDKHLDDDDPVWKHAERPE